MIYFLSPLKISRLLISLKVSKNSYFIILSGFIIYLTFYYSNILCIMIIYCNNIMNETLINKVEKFLRDKGILNDDSYTEIKEGAEKLFELRNKIDCFHPTIQLDTPARGPSIDLPGIGSSS